ncbi:unnamed protein product [Oncorhynchus mykiss]|uniref:Uncharacterized protein n=1 Tax=Oncorhynchus mykiss TaxID=8022 RepID=A0A060W156_ONCMY|nr:unnamed protein product [Oncorhynchus mykiss]
MIKRLFLFDLVKYHSKSLSNILLWARFNQLNPSSCRSPDQSCINTPRKETNPRPTTDMIIRLGRLTPGYFRLLQRQVAGEVQTQPQDRAVNQIAMMLAIMGLSLSYYSAKRMTEKVHRLQKRRDPHTP